MSKVAFITSIMGNFEATCKPFVKQTIDSDFICFTDNPDIPANGWIVDTDPYWKTHPSKMDDGFGINSTRKSEKITKWAPSFDSPLNSNHHPFNLAKYYKQAWHNIPRLKEYDVVVWLDGTIEITKPDVAEYMLQLCEKYYIVSWHHELRGGHLAWEASASFVAKYIDKLYYGNYQPYQDVIRQYHEYIEQGYDESYWVNKVKRTEGRGGHPSSEWGGSNHFGMWITCFVAFKTNCTQVEDFLDKWYLQTLKYTTQDQVGFPKTVQDTGLIPYTLPDERFPGNKPHEYTYIFIKHDHQK